MTITTAPLRFVEAQLIAYRRTWRGTIMSSFVNPVLFLTAMGLGLGSLIDSGRANLTISYLAFVATGLMAAQSMQSGAGQGLWEVMAAIKWRKSYHGAITTPISPSDIIVGRLVWTATRLTLVVSVFAVIATLFGALELGPALLAVPAAVLTGLAFSSVLSAWTFTLESEEPMANVFRFVVVPLFLFSGTFFPISQLPGFLRTVAYATPLFHGVELVRKIALPGGGGDAVSQAPLWVHFGYLTVMTAIGVVLGIRLLDRRLRP
jgi:lipooligosaccharide transport system permease protein